MILTDTHTHLYSEQFDPDRQEVVERAMAEGIGRFFLPAIDSTYYKRMFALKNAYPESIHLMAGLHPTHVKSDFKKELKVVEEMLDMGDFVAIGEIGIDLYWDKTLLKEQQEAFRTQIGWAKSRGLPIVIHARDSFKEIFDIMDEMQGEDLKGIFHCFTGTENDARRIIGYGFKLGIGGVVTFKNGGIDKFLEKIDLKHLVLETDAPYLAPKPLRGKRNESSYLVYVVRKLAELYDLPETRIAEITTDNSKEVFGV